MFAGRPVEAGVAVGEDAAVGRDHPVPATVGRLGHADDRLVEGLGREVAEVDEVVVVAEGGEEAVGLVGVVALVRGRRDRLVRHRRVQRTGRRTARRAHHLDGRRGDDAPDLGQLVDLHCHELVGRLLSQLSTDALPVYPCRRWCRPGAAPTSGADHDRDLVGPTPGMSAVIWMSSVVADATLVDRASARRRAPSGIRRRRCTRRRPAVRGATEDTIRPPGPGRCAVCVKCTRRVPGGPQRSVGEGEHPAEDEEGAEQGQGCPSHRRTLPVVTSGGAGPDGNWCGQVRSGRSIR